MIVELPTGTRTLFFDLSGLKSPAAETLTAEHLASTRIYSLTIHCPQAAVHAARLAHSVGTPVVADLERGRDETLAELLPWIDHLVIGIEMGRQLSGEDSR